MGLPVSKLFCVNDLVDKSWPARVGHTAVLTAGNFPAGLLSSAGTSLPFREPVDPIVDQRID